MDLKGRVVVITGGTSGIGLSIVKKLLKDEIKVIALFELESPGSTKVFKGLQKEYGERIDFFPCDVANISQLEGNFENVFQKYKTIDILINNAGIASENVPERMIDINYKAVVLGSLMMIERVGKHKGGRGGTIVNVGSTAGLTANVHLPIYCSSKHGVVSFTRVMKAHFDATGVRVMAICPGPTDTPMLATASENLDFVDADKIIQAHPATQSPDSVADALVDLVLRGRCGDVWVAEDGLPAYKVQAVEDHKSLRMD